MTQAELIAERLMTIRPKLVKGDIVKGAENLNLAFSTVYMYLDGKGVNPDTGIAIATYFNELIEHRDAQIKNI